MFRFIVYSILLILLSRVLSRLWAGVQEGLRGQTGDGRSVPQRGVQMVRDPVCGTYVLPARSVTLSVGGRVLHFCSAACRDAYRARPSTGGHVAGRTA